MSNEINTQAFLDAANAWVCDAYSLDIRYLALQSGSEARIWQAAIALNPLPATSDLSFHVESSDYKIGQIQRYPQKKSALFEVLANAIAGAVDLPDGRLILHQEQPLDYYSEMSHRERWFSELHLQVNGSHAPLRSSMEFAAIDNSLRASRPPFDGIADAAGWLGLSAPGTTMTPPSIGIRVGPPCDLIFDRCALAGDHLRLTLHAHPKFDVGRVGLSIRAMPGVGLDARRNISNEIRWGRARHGRREGIAELELQQADNVLAMLMIGTSTVRRQWFIDPAKARNNRFLAVQHFDKDLRMIRQAVLESTESAKFEQGVAALLFLLGFSPAIQLEKDSPDLIVTTPGGQLAIVECTTRIADFTSKVGKLVDRRGSLTKALQSSGHPAPVVSALICRLPRDQIAAHVDELRTHNTILIAGEDLVSAFDRVRHPNDPDRILSDAIAQLARGKSLLSD